MTTPQYNGMAILTSQKIRKTVAPYTPAGLTPYEAAHIQQEMEALCPHKKTKRLYDAILTNHKDENNAITTLRLNKPTEAYLLDILKMSDNYHLQNTLYKLKQVQSAAALIEKSSSSHAMADILDEYKTHCIKRIHEELRSTGGCVSKFSNHYKDATQEKTATLNGHAEGVKTGLYNHCPIPNPNPARKDMPLDEHLRLIYTRTYHYGLAKDTASWVKGFVKLMEDRNKNGKCQDHELKSKLIAVDYLPAILKIEKKLKKRILCGDEDISKAELALFTKFHTLINKLITLIKSEEEQAKEQKQAKNRIFHKSPIEKQTGEIKAIITKWKEQFDFALTPLIDKSYLKKKKKPSTNEKQATQPKDNEPKASETAAASKMDNTSEQSSKAMAQDTTDETSKKATQLPQKMSKDTTNETKVSNMPKELLSLSKNEQQIRTNRFSDIKRSSTPGEKTIPVPPPLPQNTFSNTKTEMKPNIPTPPPLPPSNFSNAPTDSKNMPKQLSQLSDDQKTSRNNLFNDIRKQNGQLSLKKSAAEQPAVSNPGSKNDFLSSIRNFKKDGGALRKTPQKPEANHATTSSTGSNNELLLSIQNFKKEGKALRKTPQKPEAKDTTEKSTGNPLLDAIVGFKKTKKLKKTKKRQEKKVQKASGLAGSLMDKIGSIKVATHGSVSDEYTSSSSGWSST